jgi:phage terminase small subunit
MPRELSDKQKLFADQYVLLLGNGKQAAIAAGYSQKTATKQASRLLTNVDLLALVAVKREALSLKTGLKAEQILTELGRIGLSDIRKCFDSGGKPLLINEIDDDTARAISSYKVKRYAEGKGEAAQDVIETEFHFHSKIAALEKLGNHLDLFKNRSLPIDTVEALLACLPKQLATDVRISIAFPDGNARLGQASVASGGGAGAGIDEGAERLSD